MISDSFIDEAGTRWRQLAAAPHRLFFASGMAWLVAWSGWWLVVLGARHLGLRGLEPAFPAMLTHGVAMLYLALPPFIVGFLFTVFPRWMPAPAPGRVATLVAFVLVTLGNLAAFAGLAGATGLFFAGWLMVTAGLGLATALLAHSLRQSPQRVPHAYATLAGLAAGLAGMVLFAWMLGSGDFSPWPLVRGLGLWGLVLGVYFAVCHRMIPFFSSRVVPGYQTWRPGWLLAGFVALAILRGLLEAAPGQAWLASVPLFLLALTSVFKWWPRSRSGVRLLAVLHLSMLWLPAGIGLAAVADLGAALGHPGLVGRAPLHALGMGFAGSMLVAMVTRVTLGHSGRPLVMDQVDWRLFLAVQLATVLRLTAEFLPAVAHWLGSLAALSWFLALGAWAWRKFPVYLSPRIDGKPG